MRLAIPLMAGIAAGWVCNMGLLHIFSVFALSVVLLVSGAVRSAPKWLFGIGVMAFMLSVGLFVENRQACRKAPVWSVKKACYTARLVEMPAVRGTNVKVLAELLADSTVSNDADRRQGLVYLYFSPTVESEQLSAGDMVAFESSITPPKNQGNPYEFDIEGYYYIKGVTGTTFVPEGKWRLLPYKKKGLQTYALELRSKAVAVYERLGFEKESLALLSALTLGEKRDFPKELKESYSIAGASHILALSGLHLGILYMILVTLLPVRGRSLVLRLLREIVVLAVLWGFAFIAGLSPSVVRSATLFTLMSIGRLFDNDISPINSLSFAAIAMLLLSPHLLFDVSFQLSFAAVLAILLLAPPLQELVGAYRHGAFYGYVANLLILSVVAQIGVMPFVWYYFGFFPIYFLITNLLVVPLAFVVMLLSVLVWVLLPLPLLQLGIAWLLALVLDFINAAVVFVATLPGASFALPALSAYGALALAVLLVLLLVSLFRKHWWLLFFVSCCSALMMALNVMDRDSVDGDYMIIYNNRKNPLLHLVYEGGANYLVSTVPQLDAEYEYVSTPLLKYKSLASPQWVYWEYGDSVVQCKEGLFAFEGIKVKLLDNAYWSENEKAEPVDVLVLCRGFLGRISKLVNLYPAKTVVLDGSLYKRSRERIKREYAQLGIEVVDVSECGAVKVTASRDGFELMPMNGK